MTGVAPAGRVAVVTGGASGLGRGIALGLARAGCRTIVLARGADRVAAAAGEIAAEAGGGSVEGVAIGDLAVRAEMHRVAALIARSYPDADILVNNAGGLFSPRQLTSDGLERTFALNVLAPFVLTRRVSDAMRARGGGRIVEISSAAHRGARVHFDDLQNGETYSAWRAYSRSKLELLLLTREFARRLDRSGVTVNAVHPGFVRTGFAQNNGRWSAFGMRLLSRLGGRSVRRGADTAIWAAVDPTLAHVSGRYFADRAERPGSEASRDPDSARRLFDVCAELAGE